jgi:hypothetical protein
MFGQNDYKLKDRSNAALSRMIRQNVNQRQAIKKKWDRRCAYEAEGGVSGQLEFTGKAVDFEDGTNDNFVRLLDEGVVVEGDGSLYAVIRKGVIKKWYNSLPDDFVGNIDKDHNRSIDLGTFTKSDLRLVKLEDGRYGVDVNVKLDDELYAVRDLKRMGNRKAISSEFWSEENEFVKQSTITGIKQDFDYLVPLIDEIQITGYAVVDSPKNANSYDEGLLNKASTEKEIMDPEELKDQQEAEVVAAPEAEVEVAEEPAVEAPEEEVADEPAEEQIDASADEVEEPEEVEEAESSDEPEEAPAEEVSADDGEAELAEKFETAINELRAKIAEKDAKIAELEAKLSAKAEAKNAFMNKLESMLEFTTAAEPANDEGDAKTTPEKSEGDEIVDEYSAAFANLK